MVGNYRFYFTVYNTCFKGVELVAFILPSIPSSFTVRFGIVSIYFIVHCMGVMTKYKLWKQSILNQFDEKKEDSGSEPGSEPGSEYESEYEYRNEITVTQPFDSVIHKRSLIHHEEYNTHDIEMENVILHDDYIDHTEKISPGRSDSDYSFIE